MNLPLTKQRVRPKMTQRPAANGQPVQPRRAFPLPSTQRVSSQIAARQAVPVRPAAPTSAPAAPRRHRQAVKQRLSEHQNDERFQHELAEMQETQDLREVDDDVENVATLYEWHAEEHNHRPKSARWYVVLAAATTAVVAIQLFFGNLMGALTLAFAGGLTYYIAQIQPPVLRYRLMVDGVAFNDTLYHFRDLEKFNIIYEPGETKTVIIRGKRKLTPLLHMEIGEADPLQIRDILLEFLPEDIELEEPLADIWARRLGF